MAEFDSDILVAGGGIAGLFAALGFSSKGYSVLCVDPAPPVTDRNAKGADMRSTAFLQPARALLGEIGLWDALEAQAAPLQIMRIIDAGGAEPKPRLEAEFNARDISTAPFGWNFPNWLLRAKALEALEKQTNVRFETGVSVSDVITRSDAAYARLSDGRQITSRLVVAADGRNSAVRRAAGIDVKTICYGQKALAFTVSHPIPHENVSTEIHRSGGPFTLVPLPDRDGSPASAIVWMERSAEAERLAALPVPEFEEAMNTRSCGILGPLTLTSPRPTWPIISQYAERMSSERVALMAEAAHVVPPIGAQGLNMSLADLRVLLDLATSREALGTQAMLDSYHKARHADIRLRVRGIDALNRASMVSSRPLRDLRAMGLNFIYGFKPVRQTMMRAGLGARS